LGKLYGPVIPELDLAPYPVRAGLTAALPGLVVNADQDPALGAADLHRGTLGGEHRLPVVRLADEETRLGILHDLVHGQDAGMVIIGHVQTGDLQAVPTDE